MLEVLSSLVEVLLIDLVLAGDNAVAVGLGAAVVLRIGFALVTTQLLQVIGLLLAGGLLLLWVCWKMWRELRAQVAERALAGHPAAANTPAPKTFRQALVTIVAADVSMSLDNVLAVAGAARE